MAGASVVVDDSVARCEFSVRDGQFHGVSMRFFGRGSMLSGKRYWECLEGMWNENWEMAGTPHRGGLQGGVGFG